MDVYGIVKYGHTQYMYWTLGFSQWTSTAPKYSILSRYHVTLSACQVTPVPASAIFNQGSPLTANSKGLIWHGVLVSSNFIPVQSTSPSFQAYEHGVDHQNY